MADDQNSGVQTLAGKVADALADILRTSTSPEVLQAQQLLLRRLAVEGDVFSSRVPAPKNITEVGGYFNLLEALDEGEIREQVLASVLGVAGPNPPPGFVPTGPTLFDVLRANDRPAGAFQASIPVQLRIRHDFSQAFDAAARTIHDAGCALPILSLALSMPSASGNGDVPAELLPFLGRTLDLMPTTALNDPDADPLAVAHEDGIASVQVVARQLDGAAPNAAAVVAKQWAAIKCDANACAESKANRKYLPLTPILNAAGWYQKQILPPAKLTQPGTWARWTNTTGLVTGTTKLGDELEQRFSRAEIANSSLRNALTWVWDGERFNP